MDASQAELRGNVDCNAIKVVTLGHASEVLSSLSLWLNSARSALERPFSLRPHLLQGIEAV